MSGFVALVGDGTGPSAQPQDLLRALEALPQLTPRESPPGVRIWSWGRWSLPVTRAGAAVIVGDIYGAVPEADADLAPRRWGRALIDGAWGRYVVICPGRCGAPPAALRDPSGALEAFAWRRAGVWVVASDIEPLPAKLWPAEIALDWPAIVDCLERPLAALAQAPLRGVQALTPGRLLHLGPTAAEEDLWRPSNFVCAAAPGDAEAALAGQVERAVDVLSVGRERTLVEVSGGLDSAIVAACWAAGAGRRAGGFALNYAGDRPEGDERAWAQALCQDLGLRLAVRSKRPRPWRAEDFAWASGAVRPSFAGLDPHRDADTAALVRRTGAQAILSGGGGDAAFFQAPSPKVVADYLVAKGVSRALDPFVQDVARWLGRSIWSVLLEAARRRERAPRLALSRFVRTEVRSVPGRRRHPWLVDAEALPPAKRLQIAALVAAQEGYGPSRRAGAAPVLQPLLSQPVLELCLAIPAWTHVAGGVDRGLARRAFADRLPAQLTARRSKGSLTSLYARQAAASLDVLRPLLLDGVLARAGVLDRDRAAEALTPERLMREGEGLALLRAAPVEAWVRHWQARIPDAAAARP